MNRRASADGTGFTTAPSTDANRAVDRLRRCGAALVLAALALGAGACGPSRFDFSQAVETGSWRDPNMNAAVRVSAGPGAIDVTVEDVPLDEPVVLVGLLLADRTGEVPKFPAAARYVPTRSGVARTRFSNVPAGRYAIIAASSETGVLEIDPEGFVLAPHGWSNDAGSANATALFDLLPGEPTEITVIFDR